MNESITRAMNNFRQHFAPAYTLEESDDQLTTAEIFEKFNKLTYDPELSLEGMHGLLEENGFRYDYIMDEFRWLIKNVQ